MKIFLAFGMAEYDFVEVPADFPADVERDIQHMRTWSREDRMSSLLLAFEGMPRIVEERALDNEVTKHLDRRKDRD